MSDKSKDKIPAASTAHREEMLSLVETFIKISEEQLGTEPRELSREASEYLLSREWSGNEKELEIAVKRACILADDEFLQIKDFDLRHRQIKSIGKFIEERLSGFMRTIKSFEKFDLYNMVVPEVEKALIMMVMKETKGNQIKAANLLGINRNTLRSKIKKLGLQVKK
jgi:DNA-binding NtrC family response regulator